MIIKVLDKKTMGYDIPISSLSKFGALEEYDNTDQTEVLSRCKDADVIITNKVKITDEIIRNSKQLKLVCVFATGYDNIDVESAKKHGVAVCNVPAYSTDSVALVTVATVLSLCTRLREYNDYVVCGAYSSSDSANYITPTFNDLRNKTWGIIGLGNIGKAVAAIARSFGMRVIANKRTPVDGYECVDLDTIARESDVITVHTPLTEKTRGLVDSALISKMKKNVILVNEARGAVLVEEDVAEAIKRGDIGAFGCDVYSAEPFSKDHPYTEIMDYKNVLLTPHFAWSSYEARVRCVNVICDNIRSFIDGKILNRVDK